MNSPAVAIVAIFCLTTLLLALPVLAVYLFHRGQTKANPLPSRIENLINPKPKPPAEPLPVSPIYPCPHCSKQAGFALSSDQMQWICKACKQSIPTTKARKRE